MNYIILDPIEKFTNHPVRPDWEVDMPMGINFPDPVQILWKMTCQSYPLPNR